jgi:AcrR family transcriptional regulator
MPVSSASAAFVPPTRKPAKTSAKGLQTKAAIVEAALSLAAEVGLDGLTIGNLADVMHMSKSGVFAHFGSREELQVSVVWEYHHHFRAEVFEPALAQPKGLPRLRALIDNWVSRISAELASGCLFTSGAVQFETQDGPVREALTESVSSWLAALGRAVEQAKAEGHLRQDCDAALIALQIHGLILSLHYQTRFLKNHDALALAALGFDQLLRTSAAP